jgi:flagellar hook-associated protein 1 FlgK
MLDFTLGTSGRVVNIDSQINGGKLGGLRHFQQQALAPAFDELGRIAIALADTVNSQHQMGMDLEGELGGLFFKEFNSEALTRNGAADIAMQVRREEDLAFASPVRATSNEDNKGTGVISQGTMFAVREPDGTLLSNFTSTDLVNGPLTVSFIDKAGVLEYVITDGSTPGIWTGPYTEGQGLFGDEFSDSDYQGFQFNVTGKPEAGDKFTIQFNKNGVSDNRNAEALASFGTKNTLNNGSQSFAEGYAGLVENVGVQTRQSQLDLEAGKTLLEQSFNQRESVSGVNLDQEAGKLIQYQAAYNASAKVITVAQDLFNTLLQTFR